MASSNNLDTLSQDGELPFGHPGRRFDDTPEGFEPAPLVDQGPELDYTPDEDGRVVHYGPGDRPLCGNDSVTAVYTDGPALVSGCRDCLELVAEDPGDDNEYMGHCLHCRREITARGGVEWRRVAPRALPALREAQMVKGARGDIATPRLYSNEAPQGAIRGLYRRGTGSITTLCTGNPNRVHGCRD